MTITGNVSGSGSLIKQGKNELVLNSNTTIGGLQVETGKVRIGATSSIDRVQLGSTTTLYIGEKGQLVTNTVSGDGELVLQNGTLKAAKGGSSISSATTYTDAKIDLSQGSLSLQGELSGSGTLQVSGQNTLTLGKTDYSTAVLDLSGSTLAVNDGTSLGTLTLKDGASVTIAGSETGTLTLSSLSSMSALSGSFVLDLNSENLADKVITTSFSEGNVYLTLNANAAGEFDVFQGASSLNDLSVFHLDTQLLRGLTLDSTTLENGLLKVTITGEATPLELTWNGTADEVSGNNALRAVGEASTSTTTWYGSDSSVTNWTSSGEDQHFQVGDKVTFNDDAAIKNVVISGQVNPSAIVVDNSAGNDYSFSADPDVADSGITGETTTLTKKGAGKLSISNANSYKGGTTIEEGDISIADGLALGKGNITFAGGSLSASESVMVDNVIAAKEGSSVLLSSSGDKTTLTVDLEATGEDALAYDYDYKVTGGSVTLVMPVMDSELTGTLTVAEGALLTLGGDYATDTVTLSGSVAGIQGTLALNDVTALVKSASGELLISTEPT
jgi:autotransporter-associated beta strand protein